MAKTFNLNNLRIKTKKNALMLKLCSLSHKPCLLQTRFIIDSSLITHKKLIEYLDPLLKQFPNYFVHNSEVCHPRCVFKL